jgi:hypothetical protein
VSTVAAANGYLRAVFVPDYTPASASRRPSRAPHSSPMPGPPLADVLCVQADRQVGRDSCVQWGKRSLQIPPQLHRHHYVKATVRVHEYPDGRLAIFDGPRCLARYDPAGTSLADQAARRAA